MIIPAIRSSPEATGGARSAPDCEARMALAMVDGRPVALIIPAGRRVVPGRLGKLLGADDVRLDSFEEMGRLHGDRGMEPDRPTSSPRGITLLMDASLLSAREVEVRPFEQARTWRLTIEDWLDAANPDLGFFTEPDRGQPNVDDGRGESLGPDSKAAERRTAHPSRLTDSGESRSNPMQPPRTILFAADFSEDSIGAFGVACALAAQDKTLMIAFHVIDTDRDEEARTSPSIPALLAARERRMREVYIPARPIELGFRTSEGPVAAEILRTADEVGADLIAMGTHGRTRLGRLLAGSVALDVLRQARCTVLALRGDRGVPRAGEVPVILHPTDFSEASEASLKVATSLARGLGARLVVLHVVPKDLFLEGSMVAEFDPWDYENSLHAIRKRLEGAGLRYPVETSLGRGYPAEEILRKSEELPCDQIVMGTHGYTGLGHLLMGDVAEIVLPRAECAVLVVKPSRHESSHTAAELIAEAQAVG